MNYGHIASEVIKKVGRKAIADHFRIAKESTYTWERTGIPPARVLALEALSGISRHEIRPDIFGEGPRELDLLSTVTANHRSGSDRHHG